MYTNYDVFNIIYDFSMILIVMILTKVCSLLLNRPHTILKLFTKYLNYSHTTDVNFTEPDL